MAADNALTLRLHWIPLDEARHAFSVLAEDPDVRQDNDAETMAQIDRIDAVLSVTPDDGGPHDVTLSLEDWEAVRSELENRHSIADGNAEFLASDRSRGLSPEWEREGAPEFRRAAIRIRAAIALIERETQR